MDTDKGKKREEGTSFLKLALIPWIFYLGMGVISLFTMYGRIFYEIFLYFVIFGGPFVTLYSMSLLIYGVIDFNRLREVETERHLILGFILSGAAFLLPIIGALFDFIF